MRPYQKGDHVEVFKNTPSDYFQHIATVGNLLVIDSFLEPDRYKVTSRFFVLSSDIRPKYWFVKKVDDPRWQRIINYLNTKHRKSWVGIGYNYYGYDGGKHFGGTECHNNSSLFNNNAIELTLDEWIAFGYDKDIYKEETKSTNTMKEVTLSRKQLVELREKISCSEVKKVVEYYLDKAKYAHDFHTVVIEQRHLDRIGEMTADQKVILSGYFNLPEEKFYKIGQYFKNTDDSIYVLARVEDNKCLLVNLKTGGIWTKAIDVLHILKITQEEFDKIAGGRKTFTQVEVTITEKK